MATKMAVGIVPSEEAEPEVMKRWRSDDRDIRSDLEILTESSEFIESHGALSVVMTDQIIGCPHEERIDYPEGEACPDCPFWAGRDRWTGERID